MSRSKFDRTFFRNAILDTIVPEASDARLPEVLDDADDATAEDELSLISIKQRRRLFFGTHHLSLWRITISYSFTDAQMKG